MMACTVVFGQASVRMRVARMMGEMSGWHAHGGEACHVLERGSSTTCSCSRCVVAWACTATACQALVGVHVGQGGAHVEPCR